LIQGLRGIKPVENDILNAEKTVNKEKMASYAEILKDDGKENENTNTNTNTKSNSSDEKIKPVFLKDEDVFGSSMKPARSLWLTGRKWHVFYFYPYGVWLCSSRIIWIL
jgi:hypothetical protein